MVYTEKDRTTRINIQSAITVTTVIPGVAMKPEKLVKPAKNKKTKKPWYKAVVEFTETDENEKIPIISQIFKGDQTVSARFNIPRSESRVCEIIRTHDPKNFKCNADVQRAGLRIGLSLLYEMCVDDAEEKHRPVMDADEEFVYKMQTLDTVVNTVSKLYECLQNDIMTQQQFNERSEYWMGYLDSFGLRKQGEEKLKRLKSGDKVINLMSCKTHGGDRT